MEYILVKRRGLFFNNLILLGLDSESFEKKWGFPFHKDMFVIPNKQGFEAVTYFLFSKLSAVTEEDYKLPWPLVTKELERMFQKTCYAHLSSFAQEDVVNFPNIVPSLLSTFGGDRFYEVYMAFSSYVLSKTMVKKGFRILSMPTVTRDNFIAVENVIQLSTIAHVQAIKETQQITYETHLVWTKVAKNLSDCLEELKKLLKFNQELKEKDACAIRALLNDTSPDEKLQFKKITEKIFELYRPLQNTQKKLENLFSLEAELWQHLASEIGEGEESQILDGQEFNISLLEFLPENLCSEIEKTGITTAKEDEKLSILRFIKLLQAHLNFITKVLEKADLWKLHENCCIEDASSIQDSLNSVEKLVTRLAANEIPDVKKRIKELKSATDFDQPNTSECSAILPLQRFDLKSIQERVSHFEPGELFQFSCPDLEYAESQDPSFNLEKCCPENFSVSVLPSHTVPANDNESTLEGNIYYETTAAEKNILNDLLIEESLTPIALLRKTQMQWDNIPSTSEINVPSLGDVDFDSTRKFSMRDSWLQEESLNSVTNPNISFDD